MIRSVLFYGTASTRIIIIIIIFRCDASRTNEGANWCCRGRGFAVLIVLRNTHVVSVLTQSTCSVDFDISISGFFLSRFCLSARVDFDSHERQSALPHFARVVKVDRQCQRVGVLFFNSFIFFTPFFWRGNLHSRKSKESEAVKRQKSLHANSTGQLVWKLQRRVLCITVRTDGRFARSGE